MRIGLLNLEPKYRNYALDKLRCYWQNKGADVENYLPLANSKYDKLYCSSLFAWTKYPNYKKVKKGEKLIPPRSIIGGTGFNLETVLPPEIEEVKPRLNYGFTTRGCIRNCGFCVVRQKEGNIRIVGDLLDLWDGKSKDIVLHDNNILALPDHFLMVCEQARSHKIKIEFNQGLDHRLLNTEIVNALKTIRHDEYIFAFDNPSYFKSVDRAITMLQDAGIKRCSWFVLVGYDTTFQEDLDRLNYLKSRNQNAYVQRYNGKTNKVLTTLARWANQRAQFQGKTWEQFCATELV